ncbi:general secretion pathway protein GspB [Congregibacter variabilis]|uniref:General secretion pathway protein GspB n=1 Tax=Congregibacter variabilis TaxID=3081200 RepID=A0ABZ0I2Y5_9GAMM|nr:general secretion pathway protein GspB [Congregibacter sp. IMCC43200]
MSLILDALSRAEREKREQANPAPSILSQELAPSGPEKSGRGTALSVAAALSILLLIAASLIYFMRDKTPQPLAIRNVESSPEQRSEQAQRQVNVRAAPQTSAAPASELAPASDIDQVQRVDAVAALYAMSAKEVAESAPQATESAAKKDESIADRTSAEQSVAEELIDIEQVLRQMRAKADPGTLVPHPAPLLEDLTKQFRDRVPTLMYSAHDFNSAGRSSVVINGETLTLRQRSRGVEVREILADSVILRFEDTDFRLKSLNSWVNL